jgi:hypothetical protein
LRSLAQAASDNRHNDRSSNGNGVRVIFIGL